MINKAPARANPAGADDLYQWMMFKIPRYFS